MSSKFPYIAYIFLERNYIMETIACAPVGRYANFHITIWNGTLNGSHRFQVFSLFAPCIYNLIKFVRAFPTSKMQPSERINSSVWMRGLCVGAHSHLSAERDGWMHMGVRNVQDVGVSDGRT